MKKTTLVTALALIISIPAIAKQVKDWKYIRTSNEGIVYYYDANSLKLKEIDGRKEYVEYNYKSYNPITDKTKKYTTMVNCFTKDIDIIEKLKLKGEDTVSSEKALNDICKIVDQN